MAKDIILQVANDIPEAEIMRDGLTKSKELVTGDRIEYTPNKAYGLLFPNGLQLYYNQIIINLLFDGRVYKFTQPVIDFIESRISEFVDLEMKKEKQFENPIFGSIQG
jgi:hypothetical protein